MVAKKPLLVVTVNGHFVGKEFFHSLNERFVIDRGTVDQDRI